MCIRDRPTAGEVVLFESDRAAARAAGAAGPDEGGVRRIGVLIEEPGLLLNLSAYRNLMAKALAWGIVDGPARCEEVLRLVGLSSVGNKKVRGFSLGMKQRLGLAMAPVSYTHLDVYKRQIASCSRPRP